MRDEMVTLRYGFKTRDIPEDVRWEFSTHEHSCVLTTTPHGETTITAKSSTFYGYWDDFYLSLNLLKVDPEWDTFLRETCELLGIEYQESRWLLTTKRIVG